MDYEVEVAVIGAGTAGLSAAAEVRRVTDDFVIIDRGPLGTTCARTGCMPSKVLVQSAHDFYRRRQFKELGIIGADALSVDSIAVLRRVRRLRDRWVEGVVRSTRDYGEKLLDGHARFTAPNTLVVNGTHTVKAKRVVIATGSSPMVPRPWQAMGERILTTDNWFELPSLPRRVGIVGLGVIGAELGQAIAMLGSEVTAFEAGDSVAGIKDPVVNEFYWSKLEEVMRVVPGTAELSLNDDGSVKMQGAGTEVDVDVVLACLGRRPNLSDLDLELAGIELGTDGLPTFDPVTMRVEDSDVFIAGDANQDRPLLHEAADEGRIAGRNAVLTQTLAFKRRCPLSICFTHPNACHVGAPMTDFKDGEVVIGEVTFDNQGRATAMAEAEGHLRLYARRTDGRLLGAAMAMPHGEHMAHLLALAVQKQLTVADLLRMPFYHPVLEEGLRTALRKAVRQVPGLEDSFELALCEEDCLQVLS